MLKKILSLIVVISSLLIAIDGNSQMVINGPAKVDAGSTQCYGASGGCGATGYCWSVTGAADVGTGTCSIGGGGQVAAKTTQSSSSSSPPGGGGGGPYPTCTLPGSDGFQFPSVTSVAYATVSATSNCGSTASLQVTIIPPLSSGSVLPGAQTIICGNQAQTLTCSPSGGDGTYTYQWQSSPDNSSWTTIGNVSGNTYSPPVGSSPGITYYRVIVTSFDYSKTSVVASVSIIPPALSGGTISNPVQAINYNTVPASISCSLASGGNCSSVTYTYNWQYSTDSINWNAISNTNIQNYSPGLLTTTTYFRRLTSVPGSTTAYSNVATVKVYPPLVAGSLSPSYQSISYNSIPASLSLSGTSGGDGNYWHDWQSATDSSFSNPVEVYYASNPDSDFTVYSPPQLTTSLYYRVVVYSNGASIATAPVYIKVNPRLVAGVLNPSYARVNSGDSPGSLVATVPTGGACNGMYRYQWQSSSDGINWSSTSAGDTTLSYNPGSLTGYMNYRLKVSCGIESAYTNICVITVGNLNKEINYIRVRNFSRPGVTDTVTADGLTSTADVQQNTQYFDELGRSIQTVNKQASPLGSDMVSLQVYDPFGRESTKYLPYTSPSADGNYKPKAIRDQSSFNTSQFPSEQFYYGQIVYDSSPLNRVLTTYAPGSSWIAAGRGVSNSYLLNTVADSVQIWNIALTAGSLPSTGGAYSPGALMKTVTADEQNQQVVEYKDKDGHVILKKAQLAGSPGIAHAGWLCTYYVYDDVGNLRFVMQPRAVELINGSWTVTQSIADELCFRYEYDNWNRMIIKKVPGAGEVWMVYDMRNRLVFSQDANQRANNNQWLATIYDGLNRVTTTGLINYNGTQAQLQQLVTTQTASGGDSTLTVTGSSPATLPANLALSGQQLSGDYQATQSVSIGNESSSAGEFVGETVTVPASGSSNVVALNSSPLPAGVTLQPLTVNFYDDYSWVAGSGTTLPSALDGTNIGNPNYFITSYNATPTYAVQPVQFTSTRGLPTGSQSIVLGSGSQYLTMVNFYDDRGRVIQAQMTNLTGGKDISTHQYDFSGRLLRTLEQQQKAGSNPQSHVVLSKMNYDPMGRLLTTTKTLITTINGQVFASPEQVIANNQYNELGQLRAKYLGGSGTAAIDSLVYGYNIRGWLTGINQPYLASGSSTPTHYFGMELGYDKSTSVTGTTSYTTPAFNGNIAGTIWKSAGDGVGRKYDFSYDNVNRLTGAAFLQYTSGSSWDNGTIDFTVSGLNYDANGNILSIKQKGYKVGGSTTIDSLVYAYMNSGQSNKLVGVLDGANDQNSKLGDFHYNPTTKGATDYSYDANGNLLTDNNKAIDQISYNHLNLPQSVHMNGKGTILYTYDATGNKLKKVTMDSTSGHSTTTLYLNGFIYQQTDSINNPGGGVDTLQFTGHEEGRARWAFHKTLNGVNPYWWEYDFFEKDHLGNTRIVLTEQKDTAHYLATMEAAYRNTENALFYNIPTSCVSRTFAPGYPADYTVTNPNDSVARVNGNGPKVGPAIILKVMSGDKVDIGVNYYYNNVGVSPGSPLSASDLINSLASGIVSLTGGGAHGSFSDLTGGSSPLPGSLTSFIQNNNVSQTSKPNAYLNWVLFDNQFNYVAASSNAMPIGAYGTQSGGGLQAPLAQKGISMTKSGYLYIYVSNSTPGWDVFFDNLSVTTYSGPMLEENHYYPFGLSMSGISDKALKTNYAENKYRYNKGSELQNKEFSDGSGLEMYETNLRELDPQLGRWWQLDSKPDYGQSLYSAMGNNPILHNDPLGDTLTPSQQKTVDEDFRRMNAPRGDQTGLIRNATNRDYEENPIGAFGKDVLHFLAEFSGLNTVDDKSAGVRQKIDNGTLTIGDGVDATVNIMLASAHGEGGGPAPEGNVHSVYGDGVKVMEGDVPGRLGEAKPDPAAGSSAHTQLRWDTKNGRVYQGREFTAEGKPVRDIDFTAPTDPKGRPYPGHPIPHQHLYVENPSGGTMQRQKAPLPIPINGSFQ